MMTPETVIPVTSEWAQHALINAERYRNWYKESVERPDIFWAKQAEEFVWKKQWERVKNTSFVLSSPRPRGELEGGESGNGHSSQTYPPSPPAGGGVSIRWFEGGKLNITENCLDRHLPARATQTAYIWEGDDPAESKRITYGELYEQVCRLSNALKSHGVKKGDRVTIYLPMIPEAAVAMLACARIGAVHSVVFAGFSADALAGRIADCNSKLVITADESLRGGRKFPLKANVDTALKNLGKDNHVHRVIVVRRTGGAVEWDGKRDVWYHDEIAKMSSECAAETMDAEDPLYILYTSGSTGKPKGVLHTIGGYMVWASVTHKYTFDYHAPNPISDEHGDIFWCTADIGWVTGHTYGVYGPLLNAATSIMYEGIPTYPDYSRFWKIIDKHKVTIFHTAPTAIRALMREGDDYVTKTSRKSLRLIGSVGEPINPEAWLWYWRVVGEKRCPIVDTWWQTETGGNMIAPFPGATDLKPGSATLPFFGVQPVILSPEGKVLSGACEGLLCIKDSWPGQARTIYGDHARFEQTYFSQMSGYYFTGDGAKRDADGYYWITGRVDDVLNVSGHRLGTAEIESALVAHKHVAEAAVVGFPHDIKGQGIYAYVTLNAGVEPHESLHKELVQHVRMQISPIATPDHIHFTPALPKTRSGKIMRRILRKIAEGETDSLGDTSTLTNPEIVDVLIKDKKR